MDFSIRENINSIISVYKQYESIVKSVESQSDTTIFFYNLCIYIYIYVQTQGTNYYYFKYDYNTNWVK